MSTITTFTETRSYQSETVERFIIGSNSSKTFAMKMGDSYLLQANEMEYAYRFLNASSAFKAIEQNTDSWNSEQVSVFKVLVTTALIEEITEHR